MILNNHTFHYRVFHNWDRDRKQSNCLQGIQRDILRKYNMHVIYHLLWRIIYLLFFRNNVITLPIMKMKKKITKDKQLIKPRSQYHKQNIRYLRQFSNPRCRTQFVSINVQLGPLFERFTNLNRIHQIYLSNCLIVGN